MSVVYKSTDNNNTKYVLRALGSVGCTPTQKHSHRGFGLTLGEYFDPEKGVLFKQVIPYMLNSVVPLHLGWQQTA